MFDDIKLRCVGLTKSYGDFVALRPTDLEMISGEFLTLLGPSGSGKTTLLTLIAGIISADGGTLWIDGKQATKLPSYARGIGMVFQSYALFPHMTVFENIAFPLRMRKISEAQIRKAVSDVLDLIRLSAMSNRYPRELSGGQQQRVALARCFVYRPSIILMDEPLGALDKKLRDQMQYEIKKLQKDLKATVLYVTHDQDEAMAMSDRICLMNNGGIEQIGMPSELYFNPISLFAADFLGESNLIEARITAVGPDPAAEIDGCVLPISQGRRPLKLGEKVTLMIRPEHVQITTLDSGAIEGKVETVTMLGGIVRTTLRTARGLSLTSKSLSDRETLSIVPESRVGVRWPAHAAIVIGEAPPASVSS